MTARPSSDHSPASEADWSGLRRLSPRRKSTEAHDIDGLVSEQLGHFGIDPAGEYGRALSAIARRLYESEVDLQHLWQITASTLSKLDRRDRIAYFNAKKFLSFQLAKLLDTLQNPSRRNYQKLDYAPATIAAKGPYAVFDNVTALFSATPVIARTATYVYACAEWIEDAFQGKELLLEIYSRLLNPTSVALANHIVDLEAGPLADQYMAWNFNSGMAAIDGVLSHVLGRDDVLITSRHIYGGAHQLIHDWYGKSSNLEIGVESFDGYGADDFIAAYERAVTRYADRLSVGRKIYLYLESPCNPHGYVLDMPRICKAAHDRGVRVMLDATVGTPFLYRPLQRDDPAERPDFVIHSYTKDLSGTGSVIAGVVIGRNEDMFIPKGESFGGRSWNETLFWNVFYVKGAFLNADAAFEVLGGIHTLELRMLAKCVNTEILARYLAAHPSIRVNCHALEENLNAKLRAEQMYLGLPAPLFTIDIEGVPRDAFQRFFDNLSPTFGHMISLGQTNTIVSCPALTTHSELSPEQLAEADISPTTIRFAVGHENPLDLVAHFRAAAELTLDEAVPGFSSRFLSDEATRALVRNCYTAAHSRYIESETTRPFGAKFSS